MKFRIIKFSKSKAKKAVINSSKIEGYKVVHDRSIKIRTHKIASKHCMSGGCKPMEKIILNGLKKKQDITV